MGMTLTHKHRTIALAIVASLLSFLLLGSLMADKAGGQVIEPNGPEDRCPQWSDGGIWVGHNPGNDQTSITFTAPDGWYVTDICVKAGSENQGDGPEFIHYDPPQHSVTFSHSSGKQISHWSVIKVYLPDGTTTTTVPEETTTTTEPEETTTTTAPDDEETTTTTVPDDSTTTTDPGDGTTTTDPGDPTTTTESSECYDDPDTPERECTPRTGAEDALLAAIGAALLGGGTALVVSANRKRKREATA